ncbi:MAG TPA: DUF2306 domain-containing protein [Vicinamibacterales bacterium]|nr:DUF2306 domain-containing protein [Vicinamibacterales bacterium]
MAGFSDGAADLPRDRRLPRAGRMTSVVLGSVTVVAVVFVVAFALPHVTPDPRRAAIYASRRPWLLLHIAAGTSALLAGPLQLWLGLHRCHLRVHRWLGRIYAGSVAIGAAAALVLAAQTPFGWVFGMGLTGLAVAWVLTTALAVTAIRRGALAQHAEWMVRSYVVTFAFVTFRMLVGVLQAVGIGTNLERLAAASWFCWAVPLLVTEAVLQWRNIRVTAATPARNALM